MKNKPIDIAAERAIYKETNGGICLVTVAQYRKALDELERLRAIVDKLPKTADGVPVVPGLDNVWVKNGPNVRPSESMTTWRLLQVRRSYCYSTREAAEAAKQEQGE